MTTGAGDAKGSRMTSGPSFLKRMLGLETGSSKPEETGRHSANLPVEVKPPEAAFGMLGEKGEKVGENIAYFLTRLDEVYSLRQEFASVAQPMQEFIASHSQSQRKLAETTALLARERDEAQALRAESVGLRKENGKLENALLETRNRLKVQEEAAESRGVQLKSLGISHEDATSRLDWATRQLALEAKNKQDHAEAHRLLSDDLNKVDQQLASERARYVELRDFHEGALVEAKRLEGLVERLRPKLAAARQHISELETEAGATATTIGALELKVAAEQESRRATDMARAQEKIAFENDIASLTNQIEALESRHLTTTKLFEQSRSLLNEKMDELRATDRSAKDALAEKLAAERRHASAEEEIRRLQDQATAFASRNHETQERNSMLTNAMAAKDAHIEQLQGRHDALKNQHDDVIARHEQERLAHEGVNRKLIEEVQTERAERALAQGALTIARGSREKLLSQIEDLKRNRPLRLHDAPEPEVRAHEAREAESREAAPESGAQTNIHKFRTLDPTPDGH